MKFILYSAFLLLLAPCNSLKNTAKAQTPDAGKNLKTVSFILQKTACFGKCPVYTLTITGENNTALLKGDMNIDKIGNYKKTISDEELTTLVNAFDKNHFFDLLDEYNKPQVMDVPSIYITYSIDGKTKKIKDRWQAPNELKDLEKLLEAIALSTDGWEKTE
ncbi:MAG: hypothetical protein JWP12_1140 [Bacteroidetes bacterium]|nr:hypothetical protein [Bacteroidota bacterium]